MSETRERHWFPAKRYGWGWGFPATWEGWLVFGGYLAAIVFGAVWLVRDPSFLLWYLIGTLVLTAMLLVVCYVKGEPPRWRWGDDT